MYITLEIKKDWIYLFSEKVELLNLGLMKWKFLKRRNWSIMAEYDGDDR